MSPAAERFLNITPRDDDSAAADGIWRAGTAPSTEDEGGTGWTPVGTTQG
jgi:hypothetical protein